MKQKIKTILKQITPPIIISIYRRILYRPQIEILEDSPQNITFTGNYDCWSDAINNCTGYDSTDILNKVKESTLKVMRGEAEFERDSVLFERTEYSWPILSGLLLAAAKNSGRLNVIDYGGALGSSFFQNRKFLLYLKELKWNVIEQPHYVEVGKNYVTIPNVNFYENIEQCSNENSPNVILLSSVLQYLPDPYGALKALIDLNADLIILDRTCYHNICNLETLHIQNVPDVIYRASYPCWFFSERKLIDFMSTSGYVLIEDFLSLDKLDDKATWKGHIFSCTSKGSIDVLCK